MAKLSSHVPIRKAALDVLAFMEIEGRMRHYRVTPKTLRDTLHFPRLTEEDLKYVLSYLADLDYVSREGPYTGAAYYITKLGVQVARHHTAYGKVELDIPSPHASGAHVHIGQGATSAFQANVHTGSGNITATQNVQLGAAQQAEILQVLLQLSKVLEGMEASTDRDTAATIVRTATDAAQKSAWDIAKGRMHGALSIISMLASAGADGPEALRLAEQALTLISGGT